MTFYFLELLTVIIVVSVSSVSGNANYMARNFFFAGLGVDNPGV
jgi:hypothetical protein